MHHASQSLICVRPLLARWSGVCCRRRGVPRDVPVEQVLPLLKPTARMPRRRKARRPSSTCAGAAVLEQLARRRPALVPRAGARSRPGRCRPKNAEAADAAEERQALAGWVRGDFTALLVDRQRQRRPQQAPPAHPHRIRQHGRQTSSASGPPSAQPAGRRPGRRLRQGQRRAAASAGGGRYLKMAEDLLKWVLRPLPEPKDELPPLGRGRASSRRGTSLELPDGWHVSFNYRHDLGSLQAATPPTARTSTGSAGRASPGSTALRISVYGYQTDKPLPFGIYAGHVWPTRRSSTWSRSRSPAGKAGRHRDGGLPADRDRETTAPVGDGIRLIPLRPRRAGAEELARAALAKGRASPCSGWTSRSRTAAARRPLAHRRPSAVRLRDATLRPERRPWRTVEGSTRDRTPGGRAKQTFTRIGAQPLPPRPDRRRA